MIVNEGTNEKGHPFKGGLFHVELVYFAFTTLRVFTSFPCKI